MNADSRPITGPEPTQQELGSGAPAVPTAGSRIADPGAEIFAHCYLAQAH